MVDVYHELSHPQKMLADMRNALKPDGLMVLLEYRAEDPDVPIKPLHKMTKAQVDREMAANGLERAREFDKLPWQHMLFYRKVEKEPADQN
jgi:predicted methyltransferase